MSKQYRNLRTAPPEIVARTLAKDDMAFLVHWLLVHGRDEKLVGRKDAYVVSRLIYRRCMRDRGPSFPKGLANSYVIITERGIDVALLAHLNEGS